MRVGGRPPFREHRISTAIYPGFPTDLQAPFSLALVGADGVSTIKENLYEDRFDYAAALQRMGASIHVFDAHTAGFYGPCQLHGIATSRFPTCARARRWCWPRWPPKAPAASPASNTSRAATKTWSAS